MIMRAGKKGVAAFDTMNQPVLHQEIERAIHRDRRRPRHRFGEFVDHLIGAERPVAGEQGLQHLAANRCQPLGARGAEFFGVRNGGAGAAIVIVVRRRKNHCRFCHLGAMNWQDHAACISAIVTTCAVSRKREGLADFGPCFICYDCGIACDMDAMKGERLFYLRRMNAWGGAVVAAPVEMAEASPAKPRPVQDPTRPPPRSVQGTPHGYRLRYTKLGRVVYLGHLDLVRHLPRIFRRAGFEIHYSVGFHPKPDLSFGPALGLGIPSLGEILDVKLVDDVSPDELGRRLRRVSLDGIDILEVARVLDNDRTLGRVITESETVARLPVGTDLGAALARFGGDEPLKVLRESDKAIARTVDVRKTLRSLSLFEDAGDPAPARLGRRAARLVCRLRQQRREREADRGDRHALRRRDRPEDRSGAAGALGRRADRSVARQRATPAHRRRAARGRGRGAVIEAVGLAKRFGETLAVDDLTLRIEAGEVVGFLGPNGSGKTTTIRLLMGLLRPSAGRASILGRDCHADAVALKREVGYLPDEPFLYPYLTGLETLELVGGLHGMAGAEARRRGVEIAERLGLGAAARAYAVTYSLGMKKRLALALALMHEPRVLILDEPTNGLDPAGARADARGDRRVRRRRAHDLPVNSPPRRGRAALPPGGHHPEGTLQAVGTPDELRARFAAAPGTTLEDLFLRVTSDDPAPAPAAAARGGGER